ncbi:hypothetical protein Rruber_05207 (plasmid) [Rhodococcus ruber]|uniref:LuxR C-terminal-related transcriptional regulator n=1 Tax=Rhodococcus ruber TaxID=1830 RepID=UPI00315CC54E
MNADELDMIRSLHRRGESITAISRSLSMSRNTVRKALADNESEAPVVDDEDEERDSDAPRTGSRAAAELEVGSGRGGRLPVASTSFIGRRDELAVLRERLGEFRLITITGPGGIGKTRLATQAATDFRRAFADGVRFVELADVRRPELLTETILATVGVTRRAHAGREAIDDLLEFLDTRQMLLVLDNCEHLIEECAEFSALLLRSTRGVRIVATSRERFASPHEYVMVLEPLAIDGAAEPESAMALFEGRARAVLGDFTIDETNRDVVRKICAKLDGVPLAIELACARLTSLSLDQLAERLDHRLDLLTTGNRSGPKRHRSMTATIEWSFEQCTEEEQLLWSRTSVFAGGFDLEMAESVCTDEAMAGAEVLDSLSGLVAKSILHQERRGRHVRFKMLEAIREYGDARLGLEERELLRHRQATWCHRFLNGIAAQWFSSRQEDLNVELRANRANIRLALDYILDRQPRDLSAAAMLTDAWFLWISGVSISENQMWLQRAVQVSDNAVHRARAYAQLALLAVIQGHATDAEAFLHEADEIGALVDDHPALAFATHLRALNESFAGRSAEAQGHFDRAVALYSPVEPRPGLTTTLHFHLGMHYFQEGRIDLATYHYEVARERSASSDERWLHAHAICGLAAISVAQGNPEEGFERALEALRLMRVFDDAVGLALIVDLVGWCSSAVGDHERAAVLLGAADAMWGSFGARLYNAPAWLTLKSRYEDAARQDLGAAREARLRAAGAAMTTVEVVNFALRRSSVEGGGDPIDGPPSRALVAGLSPREREVAEFLRQGLSNRDIADRLVLSPRTVEGHVERVLRKLNLSNRNQVASLFPPDRVGA